MAANVDQKIQSNQEFGVMTNGAAKQSEIDSMQNYSNDVGYTSIDPSYVAGGNYYQQSYIAYSADGQPIEDPNLWNSNNQMPYVGGYDVSGNYIAPDGMYAMYDYTHYSQNYGYYTGTDYGEWGTVPQGQGYTDGGYYVVEDSGAANSVVDAGLNGLEWSVEGLSLDDGVTQADQSYKGYDFQTNQSNYQMMRHGNGADMSKWNAKGGTPRQNRLYQKNGRNAAASYTSPSAFTAEADETEPKQVVDELLHPNAYNPKEIDLNPAAGRFFIIKSYSEEDVHRSIKYSIWCSTEYGNRRLDNAYRDMEGKGPLYLFFSVNGSGHFCGIARMTSAVDYESRASVWSQNKWKGQFSVEWIYVKDVPNSQLRHIKLENNENKPVTNSRDTQEVPLEKGKQVLRIIHQYRHTTSIFDDYEHYEQRQKEEKHRENQGGGDS